MRVLPDLLLLSGVGALTTGFWWWWPPAALMVLGACLIYVGIRLEAVHGAKAKGSQK